MVNQPYHNQSLNHLYQLLFADDLSLYENVPSGYPWNTLFEKKPSVRSLLEIGSDENIESRLRLLAYHLARQQKAGIPEKILLGVVVEVGLEEGLDVLATYADGRGRYFNYSERLIIWETVTPHSEAIRKPLFVLAEDVVQKIGPWNQSRRAHPGRDVVRISFLVSDGLYFGEGPVNVMFNDQTAGPVLGAATKLMQFFINQQSSESDRSQNMLSS